MSKNKLNTMFNSIGDNAVNNENTSLDIIKEYLNLHNDNKLKVNNTGIYLLLKTKNNAGIKATIKGIEKLNEITDLRKKVVNKLILPLANFSNLVETETENETVRVTIDGLDYQVPINDLNRHWRQMKKLVDAGQLTIKAAD